MLADDMVCFLHDLNALELTLDIFKNFENYSGLKLNKNKTTATHISNMPSKPIKDYKINWNNEFIETLGITFNCKSLNHYEDNFRKRLHKMENTLKLWKRRKLTLKGRIIVCNSLIIPKLLYPCSVINTPEKVIKEAKAIITNYIWNGKKTKIRYEILCQTTGKGGINLVDIENKIVSLKLSWVKRLIQDKGTWKAYFIQQINKLGITVYDLFKNNIHLHLKNVFYNSILKHWKK